MKYLILFLLIASLGCQTVSQNNHDNEQMNVEDPYSNDEPAFENETKRGIRRTIFSHLKEVRYCYEDALILNPELEGTIVIDFVIDDTGSVQEAKIKRTKSDLNNEKAQTCIIESIKTWKFPPAPKGETTKVTYPFHLRKSKK